MKSPRFDALRRRRVLLRGLTPCHGLIPLPPFDHLQKGTRMTAPTVTSPSPFDRHIATLNRTDLMSLLAVPPLFASERSVTSSVVVK